MRNYFFFQYVYSGLKAFNYKYKGYWVVVTGGSDGIGLSFAKKFAENRFPLIILSRTEKKLRNAKKLLESLGSPEVVTIQVDLSVQDDDHYERVLKELNLKRRQIGCLVNNVGISVKFMHYHKLPFLKHKHLFNVNLVATSFFTSAILPQMHNRGFGTIVNISSSVSYMSGLFIGVYGPTKVALDKFSCLLSAEYPHLTVVNLNPGTVMTSILLNSELAKSKIKFLFPSPDEYTSSAFNIITAASTFSKRLFVTTGCFLHEVTLLGMRFSSFIGISDNNFLKISNLKRELGGCDKKHKS